MTPSLSGGARLAATAILGAALTASANPVSAMDDALRPGCESRFLGQTLPTGSSVQLLVASGNTIPQGAWTSYRDLAFRVVGCSGPATRLALRPITGQSFGEPALATESVPERTGGSLVNPLHYRAELRAFTEREAAAIDQLQGYPNPLNWSDPLGALLAAGDSLRLAPRGSKRVVIMVMNGYQQTPEYNIFKFHTDPESFAVPVLRGLRAKNSLPQLEGASVVILGLTAGASGMQSTTTQITGVCRFWRSIVRAGGGSVTYCGAGLPDAGRST